MSTYWDPEYVSATDRAVVVDLDDVELDWPYRYVVVPEHFCPVFHAGDDVDAALPLPIRDAPTLAALIRTGAPTIFDSSAEVHLRGGGTMVWNVYGGDTGWLYTDEEELLRVADAIAAIPQLHEDLTNPEMSDEALAMMAGLLTGLRIRFGLIQGEAETASDLDDLASAFFYRLVAV